MPLTCLHKKHDCLGGNCFRFEPCANDKEFCLAIGYLNQTTNQSEIVFAECFQCSPQSTECVGHPYENENVTHYKCCCSQSNCTASMKIKPFPNNKKPGNELLIPLLIPSIILLLLITIVIVLLRKRICKTKQKPNDNINGNGNVTTRNNVCNRIDNGNHAKIMMDTDETATLINNNGDLSSNIKADDIHLIEKISVGPLSTVFKGTFANSQTQTKLLCAVKIFSNAEKAASQLWQNEKDVYSYLSNNEYMTKFIVAIERVNDLNTKEYWLLTEFQVNGSLYDYLKRTKLNWQQTCNFALSILEGLAYLHTEQSLVNNKTKPSIAHRDLKSKNILVKTNGTCCITDFGLAVALKSSKLTSIDVRSQVGTKRYMSPELLEGAIQFTKETLVRIDVYSCALVLWEVISRGNFYSVESDVYELPYECDVGKDPTIDDMQRLVVVQKKRPTIKPEWLEHEGVKKIIQTIEECWDTDVAARITSQCAAARLRKFISITPMSDNNIV